MAGTTGPTSLYRKVADDLRAAIVAGEYPAGTRLPSESDLADRYSVSRGTIRQAFAALRADGVIASRRGARRIVLGGPQLQSFGELASFSRWAHAIGEVPSGRVVALDRREAKPSEADQLALVPGTRLYHLTRVRLLSGRPVMGRRADRRDSRRGAPGGRRHPRPGQRRRPPRPHHALAPERAPREGAVREGAASEPAASERAAPS